MPVCQRCGEDNPERARFCLGCGAPVAASVSARREERKRVSVLFCDLVGFTSRAERLDIEDVRGLLAPYYAQLRTDLERYGGTVEKFIGDAVMALFGAPVAHEDDPERAVRAALAIRDSIAEQNQANPTLDLHVRVGVTTGEALVVLDARPAEGEGMASGDVVNTAARLQAAAPTDGILVDEATFRATDRQIDYRPAEAVAAKGKAAPVPTWQVVQARASLGVDVAQVTRTALVGREGELQLLRAALKRTRTEQAPQLVTLIGVPGIGKSRLVFELLQTVKAEADLTLWRQGRCLPYGEGVALWALGEIAKAQAGILETDPAHEADAKLMQAVADVIGDQAEAPWVHGHLRALIGIAGAEPGADRRVEAFAAWRRFCEALAEQRPTVLVVEDLHWADELLLDFIEHLVDWAADVPLLVVATARPELLSRRPGWGGGKPNSSTVTLAPLSEPDTARLVGELLGRALLPAETQAALLVRAGGNPLYAEEYVRMLDDRGFLRKVGGSWRLERAEALPLPESVQGIIAARLDALPPEDKALLADAAVLGKVGWLGALAALGDTQPSALEERLHVLERKEFVRRERRSQVAGERQYAFRHVLVRDVAYQQLPRAARADRHRRAAQWLQALSPDRAEDRAELLAHHWLAALEFAGAAGQDTAGLIEPARLGLRDAGDRALELNAFASAARWYTAALEFWPAADVERPWLLLGLGKAQLMADGSGGEVLEAARDGLLADGKLEAGAEAEALLGQLARWQGQGERAMAHHQRAVALLEGAEASRAKAFALVSLASTLMVSGRSRDAILVGQQALAIADELRLSDVRARAHNTIGCARSDSGDPEGAIAELEQAVAIAVEANSPQGSDAFGNLALTFIALGNLDRGFELRARAREAAERFGLAGQLRWNRAEQAEEDYWRGRWERALVAAEECIADTWPIIALGGRLVRGRIALARGDLAGALRDAAVAGEVAKQTRELNTLIPALTFHADALLVAGRVEDVGDQASLLLSTLADQGLPLTCHAYLGEFAVVLQALGRAAELTHLMARGITPTPWLQAASAIATGRFEEAADRYAAIGSLPDEAFARLRAAEQLLSDGRRTEASMQLQQALAFYREVRANGYVREAEALVAASA